MLKKALILWYFFNEDSLILLLYTIFFFLYWKYLTFRNVIKDNKKIGQLNLTSFVPDFAPNSTPASTTSNGHCLITITLMATFNNKKLLADFLRIIERLYGSLLVSSITVSLGSEASAELNVAIKVIFTTFCLTSDCCYLSLM